MRTWLGRLKFCTSIEIPRFQFKSTKEDIDDDSSVEYIEPIKSILPTQFTGKAETMESDISPSQYSLEDTELSLFNGVMFYFVGFDSTIESVSTKT